MFRTPFISSQPSIVALISVSVNFSPENHGFLICFFDFLKMCQIFENQASKTDVNDHTKRKLKNSNKKNLFWQNLIYSCLCGKTKLVTFRRRFRNLTVFENYKIFQHCFVTDEHLRNFILCRCFLFSIALIVCCFFYILKCSFIYVYLFCWMKYIAFCITKCTEYVTDLSSHYCSIPFLVKYS